MLDVDEVGFTFDGNNVWFRRVQDLYTAALERWGGLVQMGMTDLGGNLDILSTFRPGEGLLLDLYDPPKEVKCLTWDAARCGGGTLITSTVSCSR